MATVKTSQVADGVQPRGLSVGLVAATATYSMGSMSAGDVIQMVKVPKNATPVYVAVSGGNGQITVKVGDGVSTGRFMAGLGSSNGMGLTAITAKYVPYTYSTDDTIDILISLQSVTASAGAFNMIAIFSMNPSV